MRAPGRGWPSRGPSWPRLEATRRDLAKKARDLGVEDGLRPPIMRLSDGLGEPLPEPVEEAIEVRLTAACEEATEASGMKAEAAIATEAEASTTGTAAKAREARDQTTWPCSADSVGIIKHCWGSVVGRLRRLDVEASDPHPRLPIASEDRVCGDQEALQAYAGTLREAARRQAAQLETETRKRSTPRFVTQASDVVASTPRPWTSLTATSALEASRPRKARRAADRLCKRRDVVLETRDRAEDNRCGRKSRRSAAGCSSTIRSRTN